jgi:GNAT superfamily N-acetyltransferase
MIDLIDDPDRRGEGLTLGFQATDWTRDVVFDDYVKAMSEWAVRIIEKDEQPIGVVYQNGPEIHVSVLPSWRKKWATRALLKKIIPEPLAITRIPEGREDMAGILKRLGFERKEIYVRVGNGD